MDGLLIVNKPVGLTSRDVCDKIMKKFNINKVGHTGTLDPLAEGVLVVALGKATKLVNYLSSDQKSYEATVLLGYETDTYDVTGKVISCDENKVFYESEIDQALAYLKDQREQIPPIYSAIKVNGKKLYNYALKSKEVSILPRPIKITLLERISPVTVIDNKCYVKIRVQANKGFYVRSLVHDLGKSLNSYATMSALTRTAAGDYLINDAYSLEDILNDQYKLISIEEIFHSLPQIKVNDYLAALIKNGVMLDERQFSSNSLFRVYNDGKLIAIYAPYKDKKYKIVLYTGD